MVLEFLGQNESAFTVIFSALVAIATLVYAILTWRLVSETRKMREAQTEPNISVTIQPREEWMNFVDLIIQNIGLGPAYNIKFEINPDFKTFTGKFLSEYGFMKNGLNFFASNQKFQFFLVSLVEYFPKETFEIKVTYQNSIGKTYEDLYLIDFSQFEEVSQLGKAHLYEIANNIEKIQNDIHHISTGFHRMKVIMYSKEDVEEETKQFIKMRNQSSKEEK